MAGRRPTASVNFVTAHDGFTLADLVAYNEKHNEANGENNRDGEQHNLSWNSGVEGATDPAVLELRRRRRRNFLLTLMVSLGVPMISGGDEMGRTQRGNNNAYCHDSPLTWTPWSLDEHGKAFLAFVRAVRHCAATQPVLRRSTFSEAGRGIVPTSCGSRPMAARCSDADWADPDRQALGMLLDGKAIRGA